MERGSVIDSRETVELVEPLFEHKGIMYPMRMLTWAMKDHFHDMHMELMRLKFQAEIRAIKDGIRYVI